jgi:hypothetical protein
MMPATLVWIDPTSGEGEVQLLATGELLYLHYTCIEGIDPNRYAYPTELDQARFRRLERGAPCEVTVYSNLYSRRVATCRVRGIS